MTALQDDLRQVFADARSSLPPLEIEQRAKAVIAELANPTGLGPDTGQELEDTIRAVLRQHAAQGALVESLEAKAVVEELSIPESAVTDTPPTPPPVPPTLSTISPNAALVGETATLTAQGVGFDQPSSSICFDGMPRQTTFVSEGELTCEIPVAGAAGVAQVTVSAIGGISGFQTFTYNDPPPELTRRRR